MPWRTDADRYDRVRWPREIGELVERVVEHHRIAGDLREAQLFTDWSDLVGERIGERTRPSTIYDRVLVVEVATSTWLHELRLLRPKIVSDLLDKLGLPRFFDDIRFVLAKETRRTHAQPVRPPVRRRTRAKLVEIAPATGIARDQIIGEVEAVADPELRELIARVRIANDR